MKATKKNKQPWPTKAAMEQVYKNKLWGNNGFNFYSGEGSHNPEIVTPYIHTLVQFLKSFKNPVSVVDLGCGDFNIGRQLVEYTKEYVAIDIVEDLINYNKTHFNVKNLTFNSLDIAKNQLPPAECVILRQVLQHLSNNEVQSIVNKLAAFKYVIVTEHLPEGDFIPNKDIISGQGIRLKKQSGVNILDSPFHFKVKDTRQLLTVKLEKNKGVIVTMLYEVF